MATTTIREPIRAGPRLPPKNPGNGAGSRTVSRRERESAARLARLSDASADWRTARRGGNHQTIRAVYDPLPPLREALAHCRRAGLGWSDEAYDRLVLEVLQDGVPPGEEWYAWSFVFRQHRSIWREAFEGTLTIAYPLGRELLAYLDNV